MTALDDALDYARSARTQCEEPSLPDLQIIALADEVERLRSEPYRKAVIDRMRVLAAIADAARRYSEATRDPGGETPAERDARHRECNQAWRDLNDALART